MQTSPHASDQQLYICYYCKPIIRREVLLPRCVLNGLQLVPIPPELGILDSLSRQLIQHAKCYQKVVRLGTYTAKVPVYNSLKSCKGTMFFLPLPFNKTLETIQGVECSNVQLPDPKLYVVVNGTPQKDKVIWRTLVDVYSIKQAVQKLKDINWIYTNMSTTLQ